MGWKIGAILLTLSGAILAMRQEIEKIHPMLGPIIVAVALSLDVAVPYLVEKGVIEMKKTK
jgi:uncharacterized membrane protein